ncbi:MAG TPA: diacylglycerol kinase family protein [Bauldia sp.]|nr:diacylglycerol kinase family protein [Bauldia sp.]
MKLALVLNRHAGTLRGMDAEQAARDLTAIFAEAGHAVTTTLAEGRGVMDALRTAAKAHGTEAIVAGGGDGTISGAAGIAADARLPLGVLPLGTMNLFARSLALPTDMKEAAAAIAASTPRAVDIGKANDRVFIHVVSLGLHPAMVAEREKREHGSRWTKMIGSAGAWARVLRKPRRFRLTIGTDGERIETDTIGAVVSNNPLGKGHLPYADRLDGGILGLYVTTATTRGEILRVTAGAALGALGESPLVKYRSTTAVDIAITSARGVPVTIDGELMRLTGKLHIATVPGGLTVLAPAVSPSASAA